MATAADMAKVVKPRVRVDATASKAIASRGGVGRVRHLQTQVLWLQEAAARRELTIVEVLESKIPLTWRRNTWLRGENARMFEEEGGVAA